MNPSNQTTDPALAYLLELETIVRQGRQAPLERLLTARLHQSSEVIEGLVSPPLDRHEPDASLLLYHLYQRLADDEAARDYLRRSAVDLYRNLLGDPSADLAHAGALSSLIGYYQVATRPELARNLRLALWGLLQGGMAKKFRDMMGFSGKDLLRTNHVLDLWLAVTPPMCEDLTPLIRQEITDAFFKHCEDISEHKERHDSDEPFQLLLFSFHALLKANPKEAGRSGLLELSRSTQALAGRDPVIARRLRGDCAELGRVLARHDSWQAAFRKGLLENKQPEEPPEEQPEVERHTLHTLYWQALDRLGQAEWLRSQSPASKDNRVAELVEHRTRKQLRGVAANSLKQAANA